MSSSFVLTSLAKLQRIKETSRLSNANLSVPPPGESVALGALGGGLAAEGGGVEGGGGLDGGRGGGKSGRCGEERREESELHGFYLFGGLGSAEGEGERGRVRSGVEIQQIRRFLLRHATSKIAMKWCAMKWHKELV